MAAQDYEQVTYNSPAGAQIGQSTTEKIGFHGATPSTQRANAAQTATTFTAVAASTAGFGFKTTAKFTAFVNLVQEIRTALVAKGIIKGGA